MAIIQEKNKHKWTKDGRSWYFDVYYSDIYGNKKEKKSKLYKTKKEAQEAERNFLNKSKEQDSTNTNISFQEVYNNWIEYKKETWKCTSYYRTKKTLDKHILNYFKEYKLHSITIKVLQNWKENLTNEEISSEHKNRIISALKEILEFAHNNFDFDSKVYSKLQKLRVDKIKIKNKDSENNFWTYDEFLTFLDVVDDDYYKLLFTFLYFTGVRIGEMIALNWNDLDLEKKTLTINKSFSNKIEGEKFIITTPKTKNSNRILELDDNLVNQLKKHKEHEQCIFDFNNDMFVFGNAKHLSQTTFANHLKYYINKSQVKYITPHGFRHSHVSLLIHLGCDSREVANRIGDTVQIVESTYYHMFPSKKSNTVNALNNLNVEKYEVITR